MKSFYKKIKGQGGAALLLILAVSSLIIPLLQGVFLDSQIEYKFSRYRMNELQARYNAKSGIALNLLRIYIFKGVEKSVQAPLDSILRPVLDTLWFFPLIWPYPASEDFLESDKQELEKLQEQSFLKGAYASSIISENGLLDVNDLSSPLTSLRKFTYDSLFNLLLNSIEEQAQLKDKYQPKDLERILNNMSDWIDADNQSQNGGSEELLAEGSSPLNRSFISIEEIKKVPELDLEIFEILKNHITVYGMKALNINYSSQEVLRALNIPVEIIEPILSRTQITSPYYKPFLNQKAFCDFLDELNFSFCSALEDRYGTLDMIRFDYPVAFRVQSSGEYRGSLVNLEALLYDLSSVALSYQKSRYYEIQRQNQDDPEGKSQAKADGQEQNRDNQEKTKSKQLKIDYSYPKSLIIMYLKESS